jgi:general secretion pathway protein E
MAGRLTERLGLSDLAAERLRTAMTASDQPVAVAASLLGLADEDRIAAATAELNSVPVWTGGAPALDADAGVSAEFLQAHYAVVLGRDEEGWHVGLVDPGDRGAREGLAFALGGEVRTYAIPLSLWRGTQRTGYSVAQPAVSGGGVGITASWTDDAERLRDFSRDTPAVRLADELLERAFLARASDLHVEQKSDSALVRLRIDGALREIERLPPQLGPALIARIKVLSDLDVAVRRAPQDGRTTVAVRGQPVDVRVSTTPTLFGESLVVRLLNRRGVEFDLKRLGFSSRVDAQLDSMLERQHGLILVTGPTGSGKTTTLYAALRRLVSDARKVLTIEDPVEYVFESINQTQVNEAAGVTFASALRGFLRHDPDVILVGEIRDSETARLAVQASLTGHLVLATLHTNDAASAPARLADMGVERYLLAAVLIGVVAQRLSPALCKACAALSDLTERERGRFAALGLPGPYTGARRAAGCPACDGRGRSGRTPVAESFLVDESVEQLIAAGAPTGDLRVQLKRQGFESLELDAARRALAGEVDPADALRVASQ